MRSARPRSRGARPRRARTSARARALLRLEPRGGPRRRAGCGRGNRGRLGLAGPGSTREVGGVRVGGLAHPREHFVVAALGEKASGLRQRVGGTRVRAAPTTAARPEQQQQRRRSGAPACSRLRGAARPVGEASRSRGWRGRPPGSWGRRAAASGAAPRSCRRGRRAGRHTAPRTPGSRIVQVDVEVRRDAWPELDQQVAGVPGRRCRCRRAPAPASRGRPGRRAERSRRRRRCGRRRCCSRWKSVLKAGSIEGVEMRAEALDGEPALLGVVREQQLSVEVALRRVARSRERRQHARAQVTAPVLHEHLAQRRARLVDAQHADRLQRAVADGGVRVGQQRDQRPAFLRGRASCRAPSRRPRAPRPPGPAARPPGPGSSSRRRGSRSRRRRSPGGPPVSSPFITADSPRKTRGVDHRERRHRRPLVLVGEGLQEASHRAGAVALGVDLDERRDRLVAHRRVAVLERRDERRDARTGRAARRAPAPPRAAPAAPGRARAPTRATPPRAAGSRRACARRPAACAPSGT